MKKRIGRAGITIIFGALSAIFGYVAAEAVKNRPLDITRIRKDNGYTEDNKPAR